MFGPVRRNVDLKLKVISVLLLSVLRLLNFAFFFISFAQITPSQTVHTLMLFVGSVFEDIKLITFKGKEMWNEFLCVEPKIAFSRIENEIL